MNATLILRNGQRFEVKGISQEYLERLMNFNILAGYIVQSTAWSFFPLFGSRFPEG